MEKQTIDLKTTLKVHFIMCTVSVIFLLVVALVRYFKETDTVPVFGEGPFYLIGPVVALASIVFGTVSFKKNISAIDPAIALSEKIKLYQSAFLARQSFISAAATFNTIAYLKTGHYFFAAIAIVLIIVLVVFRPTRFKISEALQLNYTDLN